MASKELIMDSARRRHAELGGTLEEHIAWAKDAFAHGGGRRPVTRLPENVTVRREWLRAYTADIASSRPNGGSTAVEMQEGGGFARITYKAPDRDGR